MTAAERWAADLASWALPESLLAQAEDDPWALPVELFAHYAEEAENDDTPSRARALEALSDDGSVLDVGAGAGAASLALLERAGHIIAVDENAGMLEAFEDFARKRAVSHETVSGRWPDVAARTDPADVVVCHHVFYNVADLVPFAQALNAHAKRRVVVELTGVHPRTWTNPYFALFHDLERPSRPTAGDAAAVLREAGFGVTLEQWTSPMRITAHREILVGWLRRSLCLPKAGESEVAAALERIPPPADRTVATIWWDV